MRIELRDGLIEVPGGLPTFASAGLENAAARIGRIATDSYDYLARLLDRRPEAQVLVVSESDWATKTDVPLFGLPNADAGTLVVPGTEAPWWDEFASMVAESDRAELASVYADSEGRLHFGPFFDLVAVHEIGHLFHGDVSPFPRLWLQELFANLCLQAWAAERAPDSLRTLLTLPCLGGTAPAELFECRTRTDFETTYAAISGPNYAWYQFRLQMQASDLYERCGSAIVPRLFEAFRMDPGRAADESTSLDDEALAALLQDQVDPELAAFSLAF